MPTAARRRASPPKTPRTRDPKRAGAFWLRTASVIGSTRYSGGQGASAGTSRGEERAQPAEDVKDEGSEARRSILAPDSVRHRLHAIQREAGVERRHLALHRSEEHTSELQSLA